MKGWQDDRGGDEYEGKDCLGVPAAYQHPPGCWRWSAVPHNIFCLSSDKPELLRLKNRRFLPRKEKVCTRRELRSTDAMQNWCRLPADPLTYISLPYASAMLCLQLRIRVCVDVSQLGTAGVLRDEEESVSPLYLKREMIGILMDCAGQSTSNAQTHLFSNQEDVMRRWVNVNEAKQCCQWCFKPVGDVWRFDLSPFQSFYCELRKT